MTMDLSGRQHKENKSLNFCGNENTFNKMGNILGGSKQKDETGRPGSPPRSMASILRSDSLTGRFRDYLSQLDEDVDEETRVRWLNYILSCRQLHSLVVNNNSTETEFDRNAVRVKLKTINEEFFSGENRLALENGDLLWKKCAEVSLKFGDGRKKISPNRIEKDLSPLWKAHDNVIRKLDDIHQPFLVEESKRSNNIIREAMNCLL